MNTEKQVESTEVMEMPDSDEKENSTELAVSSKKKGSEKFKNALAKTGEASKRALIAARDRAQDLSEKQQVKNHEARVKKYNPLFPDEYQSDDFKLPNLIQIVDDAERRGIDVCEGAIGWRGKVKGVEILYLYDEAIAFSGLNFVPAAVCDSVYYVDPHNRQLFVNIDGYFDSMQAEKLAELQHIAYALGASRYWVEMVEDSEKTAEIDGKIYAEYSGEGKKSDLDGTAEPKYKKTITKHKQIVATATFSGVRKPMEPRLCWFEHDKNVLNLIHMCCKNKRKHDITTYTIELNNSNAASMSFGTAVKVNAAVIHMKMSCNFQAKSEEEHSRKMFFKLEF